MCLFNPLRATVVLIDTLWPAWQAVITFRTSQMWRWARNLPKFDYSIFFKRATEPRAIYPWSHQYGKFDVWSTFSEDFLTIFHYSVIVEKDAVELIKPMETEMPWKAKLDRSFSCPVVPIPILETGKWRNRGGSHCTWPLLEQDPRSPESYQSTNLLYHTIPVTALVQLNLCGQICEWMKYF